MLWFLFLRPLRPRGRATEVVPLEAHYVGSPRCSGSPQRRPHRPRIFFRVKHKMPLSDLPEDLLRKISTIPPKECDGHREIDVMWQWVVINSSKEIQCNVHFTKPTLAGPMNERERAFAENVKRRVQKRWKHAICTIQSFNVYYMPFSGPRVVLSIRWTKPPQNVSWGLLASLSSQFTERLSDHVWPLGTPLFSSYQDKSRWTGLAGPKNAIELILKFRTCPSLRLQGGQALLRLLRI